MSCTKTKTMPQQVEDFFCSLHEAYNRRCSEIIKENPNSYTSFCFDENSDDPLLKMEIKNIKKEFTPSIDTPRVREAILSKFSKNDLLFNYDVALNAVGGDLKAPLGKLLSKLYNDVYMHSFEAIERAGWRWSVNDLLSKETSLCIYDSILNDLKNPFGDDRFTVELLHSNSFYGMTNRESNINEHSFTSKEFDEDDRTYKTVTAKRIFLDAKIALLFCFKGKPSFYVGFHIDEHKNVYIRQIQGVHKGRGHYKLGDQWQKTVVQYLKNSLSFINELYVINETSAYEYLVKLYGKNYDAERQENTLKKAAHVYHIFNNTKTVSLDQLRLGQMGEIVVNDVYNLFE